MNGRTILAALAGAVTHFFLGWLIYGFFLMDMYKEHMTETAEAAMREGEMYWAYVASSILFGILITYILKIGNKHSAVSGLITAGIVTFLLGMGMKISIYAMIDMTTLTWMGVDVVVFTIMGAMVGLVVGSILTDGSNTAETQQETPAESATV